MKYDATDPKQVEEARKFEQLEEDQYYKDLRELVSTPAGVRVFSRFLRRGKIFSTSFVMGSTDATNFNLGAHNFVLRLFDDLCIAVPEEIQQLIIRTKETENE